MSSCFTYILRFQKPATSFSNQQLFLWLDVAIIQGLTNARLGTKRKILESFDYFYLAHPTKFICQVFLQRLWFLISSIEGAMVKYCILPAGRDDN